MHPKRALHRSATMEEELTHLKHSIERYRRLMRGIADERVLRELERLLTEAERRVDELEGRR